MADEKRVVLLVEDDDVDRESMHRLLDSEYQLVDAATGQQALELLDTHAPECVLLDFRLPDYSGLKLLPEFLHHQIPVVMLTAEGSEQVAVEALKAGCHDYLVKRDLTRDLLERTVDNAIDRNELQRQLKTQRHELESFVATAAHDLKGPLRAIRGFSEIAQQSLEKGELDELPGCLQTIQRSAARLAGMVDALLEYTRLDAKKRYDEVVDLNEIIDLLTLELRVTLDECGGRIEGEPLPTIYGDAYLLTQLLQNLIANGLKFRRKEPPVVSIQAWQDGDEWHVSVSDNGIGIDVQFHDEIFKPLRRLHTEEAYDGYGVGLATCQRILEKHAGRIWVESKPGHGSTFNFSLPIRDEASLG